MNHRKMNHRENLITLFESYQSNNLAVYTFTFSTFVKSDSFAKSGRMESYFENVIIKRIKKHIPYKYKSKIDWEYVIETSPLDDKKNRAKWENCPVKKKIKNKAPYYHFHGLLAVPIEVANKLFKDGVMHKKLFKSLESLSIAGKYRCFEVNAYEINPVTNIAQWATYITKTHNYLTGGA